jgi:hypothetical protein
MSATPCGLKRRLPEFFFDKRFLLAMITPRSRKVPMLLFRRAAKQAYQNHRYQSLCDQEARFD